MIQILDKVQCCGCGACVQKCPKQCISLHEDSEGFLYPKVNTGYCIDCGLCEKICPFQNPYDKRAPLHVLAAINKDEKIRMESSSGGIFTLLAEEVINEGGVVFGARFDEEWQVIHSYTEDMEGLADFRGSKYVQSIIGSTYRKVEQFLKEGRKVLYSGTPCQIAGLKHFLRKEYDNLLSVECLCHSVPSPLVWKKYLDYHRNNRIVKRVNFRDKSQGWSHYKYSLVIEYENGDKEIILGGQPYMSALTSNLSTRLSCSACKFRNGRSGADLSLGDFWGAWNIVPDLDDNKGITLLIVYSDKMQQALHKFDIHEISIDDAQKYNGGLCCPKPNHKNRTEFFKELPTTRNIDELIAKNLLLSLKDRIKKKLHII